MKGPTAAGKSWLVNRVLDIFRELGVVIEFSRITPAFLENMASKEKPKHPNLKDPDYEAKLAEYEVERKKPRSVDLTGKILFIDELRGIQNAQAPKLIISEGRLRLGTVDQQRESTIVEVRGTPSIITTTTQAALEDPEFENRVIPVQIDETEDQTKQILEHEAQRFADPAEDLTEYSRMKAIVEFFSKLGPFEVANPFATQMQNDYPTRNIEARRDFKKLLALSNVVTWLYQHQRRRAKKALDIVVVTDVSDIEVVRRLALSALRESISGHSEKEDKLLEYAKSAPNPLTIQDFMIGTQRTVRRSEQWVRDHVNRLAAEGYLQAVEQNKKPFTWRYAELQPESLDIKTEKYSNTILSAWAESYGYKLLELGLDTSQGQAQLRPLAASEPKSSPKSEFGEPALPADESGEGEALKEHPPKPNPERIEPSDTAEKLSDGPERPSDTPIIASDKPVNMSYTPPAQRGDAATGGSVQDLKIPSQNEATRHARLVLGASISGPSDTNFRASYTASRLSDTDSGLSDTDSKPSHSNSSLSDNGSNPSDGSADEFRLVRQAFRTEMDRFGQCHMAKIRYLVKEKIPDPDQVTRIVALMAKNGELEPWGHDCFKLVS